jgi:hypothetical protein
MEVLGKHPEQEEVTEVWGKIWSLGVPTKIIIFTPVMLHVPRILRLMLRTFGENVDNQFKRS